MFKVTCELCNKGRLQERIESNLVLYKNVEKILPLHFSSCDVCTSEQALPDQACKNKRLMNTFKEGVDSFSC